MSAPTRLPLDHAARTRAATDFTTNLVVSAGAGTGKTTLLIERILTAICALGVRLPEIAAITFTDKAAGELRERLASGLAELAVLARGDTAGDEPSAAKNAFARLTEGRLADARAIAAHASVAEDDLDRAVVTTIHGFCSEILRAYPLASGLPPGFVVDRGVAGRRLAAESWTPFVEAELGPGGRRAELWKRVLGTFGLAQLAEIGRALAGGSISDEALRRDHAPFDLQSAIGPHAEDLANEIRSAIDRTGGLTDAPRGWLEEAERALRAFASGGTGAARRAIEGSSRLSGKMPGVYTKKVSVEDADALVALEEKALPLLRGLRVADAQAEADLFECLLPFALRLRERQTRAGLVDFDGLLVRARDLLRDDRFVRDQEKRRFRMLLVDEFQDTDPIQYEIVFFLAERDGEHAHDAYATRLAPGRLFIVGDAKQSIYRFRGADFAAYQGAVGHVLGQGGVGLALTSNFRSTPAVLRPINALFAEPGSPLWHASDYLPRYEPIDAERADDGAPAVEVWTTSAGPKAAAEDRRLAEGLALSAEIRSLAGPGKSWRYADVLVLFRGFSDLPPYLRALRDAEIPFVVSGGRTFHERTEIIQAMGVLRAVAEPDDPVALLAFRRSPAGGVPDTELAAQARGRPGPFPSLAASDERLAALRAAVPSLPVDAAVRHVLQASGLLALSGLSFEAAQRVANLEKLASAASALARDGRATLIETLDALEDAFESDEEGDSPLADAEWDAVRVMSIHKAKGLEARIVILADTAAGRSNRAPKRFGARMTRLAPGEFVRLDGPKFKNGAAIAASLFDPRHEEAEDVRLLYVALTRARDRLFVFGGGTRKTAWTEAIASWTDGVVHRTLPQAVARTPARSSAPVGAPEAVSRFEAAARAVVALAAQPFRSPSDAGYGAEPAVAIEGALEPGLAKEVGRVVHARLSGIETRGAGAAAAEADAVLRAFDASGLAARFARLQVLGREVPMLLDEPGARWSGAIDLLYRDEDGSVVVADFKTDAGDEGAVLRHGEQLRAYARAVRRAMPGSRVRAELWMLRSGRILAVE